MVAREPRATESRGRSRAEDPANLLDSADGVISAALDFEHDQAQQHAAKVDLQDVTSPMIVLS